MNIYTSPPKLFDFIECLCHSSKRHVPKLGQRGLGGVGSVGSTLCLSLLVLLLVVLFSGGEAFAANPNQWKRLQADGLHDPKGPAIHELQQPGEALSALPGDSAGNNVNWIRALREKVIAPRTNLFPATNIKVLDMDIIFPNTGNYPYVRFPHKAHTEWLDCVNCHEKIFKLKYRATPIKMSAILEGKYCGQCHGAVAFPLTECNRCHSVNPRTFDGKVGPQPVKP